MSFSNYLEKYRSTLSSSQGQQLLKILVKKRDSGEIRTLDEFKARLKSLTTKLLENKIKPVLVLLNAVPGADTSSERYNEMLERIQDDLETAFTEANNLEEIMAAHHNLIDNVALKALRYGINELQSRITLYEFLSKSGLGFNHALYNTFAESEKFSVARSDEDAAITYSDFRLGGKIDTDEDCLIDLVGERLSLGLSSSAYVTVQRAEWLANMNSLRGELKASFANSDIKYIVDGKNNTYWIEPILLSSIRPGGATIEVALVMSAITDINFLDIEPAVEFPMQLSLVDYVDGLKVRRTLWDASIDVRGPMRINFPQIATNTLILRFTQRNYREVQFSPATGEDNFTRAVLGVKNLGIDMASASEDLRNALSSEYILSKILNVPNPEGKLVRYFEYIVGFDNLRPGFSRYLDRGVFASVRQTLDLPGQFSLRVTEKRPVQAGGESQIEIENFTYPEPTAYQNEKFYHSSVEYWLTIKPYTANGNLMATHTIPLLPLGAKRIYHERLYLTHPSDPGSLNKDQGALMFYCDATVPSDDINDVCVYRNKTKLTYGATAEWVFVPVYPLEGSNQLLTQETPNTGLKMSRGIWIKTAIKPLDIFTVSYTPKVSNTRASTINGQRGSSENGYQDDLALFNIIDMTGDQFLRIFEDNIVLMDSIKNGSLVAKTNIYLTIIMRRNSAEESFTSFIDEFMLLTASTDAKRFEGAL